MNFGSPVPNRIAARVGTSSAFPWQLGPYTSSDGAVNVPAGALNRWFTYRNTLGAVRGDVIGIGDSTMFGSGGVYSFLQRLRDRAVGAGMADGGKGMFAGGESLGITYDAPEINGFVSSTFGGGFPDAFDNTDGQYFYDTGSPTGHHLVLQSRQSCFRLWYSKRADAGDFTYSVDGGATVTVKAYAASGNFNGYVYVSGLAPNTTHTITITNLGVSTNGGRSSSAACYIALAPVNSTGVVFQKYATSGDTIKGRFYGGIATSPWTQSMQVAVKSAFGLTNVAVSSPNYTGSTVDSTQPAGGQINPVLAITQLGFNDLTAAASGDEAMWTEYVKRFAGACADAGCDGIVVNGQLPYNANWPTYGTSRYNAVKTQAAASGLAWVDLFYPIGGPSLTYAGGTNNPHLTKAQYQTQADYLWDNLLGVA